MVPRRGMLMLSTSLSMAGLTVRFHSFPVSLARVEKLLRLFKAKRPATLVTPFHFGNAVQCPWFTGLSWGPHTVNDSCSRESQRSVNRNRPTSATKIGREVWNRRLGGPLSKPYRSLTEEHGESMS
ncbi:hypothetical protein BDV19DRAFT_330420 [Aspergillus venezuelensis]